MLSGLSRPSEGGTFASLGAAPDLADSIASGSVSRRLPSSLAAVREARDVVSEVLIGWNAESIFDDVALAASELVANALRHALKVEQRFPAELSSDPAATLDRIQISLVSTGSHVICAVTDPSPLPPIRRQTDPLAGSGRGLQLVESLSLCWGWTLIDDGMAVPPRIAPALGSASTSFGAPSMGSDRASAGPGKSVWAIFSLGMGRSIRSARVVGAA